MATSRTVNAANELCWSRVISQPLPPVSKEFVQVKSTTCVHHLLKLNLQAVDLGSSTMQSPVVSVLALWCAPGAGELATGSLGMTGDFSRRVIWELADGWSQLSISTP